MRRSWSYRRGKVTLSCFTDTLAASVGDFDLEGNTVVDTCGKLSWDTEVCEECSGPGRVEMHLEGAGSSQRLCASVEAECRCHACSPSYYKKFTVPVTYRCKNWCWAHASACYPAAEKKRCKRCGGALEVRHSKKGRRSSQ